MTVDEINQEWGAAFIEALNQQEAAIVFAFGVTKDGKIRMCMTDDISKEALYKHLIHIAALLPVK